MDKGVVGERFILGGENLTFRQMISTLSELTALAPPGGTLSPGLAELGGRLMELKARLFGGDPALTYRMARDYASGYVWVTSDKAEQALGYSHRPARETLMRSVKWYLEHGYVPERAARRVHLELNPA
jgi:dihydroflavonol-4-reductase